VTGADAEVRNRFPLASTTFYYYPWWDIAAALIAFPDPALTAKNAAAAYKQNSDGRIGLSPGAMPGITPNGGQITHQRSRSGWCGLAGTGATPE